MIMLLVVTGVGFLIHIYSVGYMWEDPGFYRFFTYLNLFMFFMLTLILANNYLQMFIGWEGVGLASYLLIGFWFTKDSAASAGKKAFIVNRIGDFGFAIGLMLLFLLSGSVFYFDDPSRSIHGAFDWALHQSADPFAAGAMRRANSKDLARLKSILEAS